MSLIFFLPEFVLPARCCFEFQFYHGVSDFFLGNGDCVRCFYCDMGLRHWEPNDDPWEEHARWYPRCSYMQTVKGESYIQEIQRKYGRVSSKLYTLN